MIVGPRSAYAAMGSGRDLETPGRVSAVHFVADRSFLKPRFMAVERNGHSTIENKAKTLQSSPESIAADLHPTN